MASSEMDPRFHHDGTNGTVNFADACLIVPNNDIKYESSKRRAKLIAQKKKEPILWAAAKDVPSHSALAECPSILQKKVEWLTKHDKETGDLPGMCPLVHGLPVMLADHVDRSPEKQLLRGKIGHVVGWVLQKEDANVCRGSETLAKLPVTVFVKFPKAKWKLPGLKECGVYPIVPQRAQWHIDRREKNSVLRVTRWQLPLLPAFALTAHAAQGRTLDAAIVDLRVTKQMSKIASYVALSRVRRADDILIFRPFDVDMFSSGCPDGPVALIKWLQLRKLDVEQCGDRFIRKEYCALCAKQRQNIDFVEKLIPGEISTQRMCRICDSKMLYCTGCKVWHAKMKFPRQRQ